MAPDSAAVIELADQLFLLGVHADDRGAGFGKLPPMETQIAKLRVRLADYTPRLATGRAVIVNALGFWEPPKVPMPTCTSI